MIERRPWGSAEGQPVELFTLSGAAGMTATVSTFGGVLQSLLVPDLTGRAVNVALGFGSLDEYVDNVSGANAAFFGALVGRCANRIAGHSFVLDGARYDLVGNDGPGDSITLHGGPRSYHTRVWQPVLVSGSLEALQLSHVDPAGFNGFPGAVRNEVEYALTADNALRISYRATADAPTVVNLTNHTYFNLAGEGSGHVYDQHLAINGCVMLPVDDAGIPVGFAGVAGTPFDFRAMKPIGRDIGADDEQLAFAGGGYDHNFVLAGAGYRLAAVAWDPGTGIALWAYTDRPGVQMYTANHLTDGLVGTSGRTYGPGAAFALETQAFPDAPNHIGEPGWPSVVLRPGEVFHTRTTYKFGVAGPELAERVRF